MEPARTALAKYESAEAVDRGKHIGFVGVSEEVVISELSNAKKSAKEIDKGTDSCSCPANSRFIP